MFTYVTANFLLSIHLFTELTLANRNSRAARRQKSDRAHRRHRGVVRASKITISHEDQLTQVKMNILKNIASLPNDLGKKYVKFQFLQTS